MIRKSAQAAEKSDRQSQTVRIKEGTVPRRASRGQETARMLDWYWLSEKDVNAFLIHAIGEPGMNRVVNYNLANVKTGFGINSSGWNRNTGLVVTLGRVKNPVHGEARWRHVVYMKDARDQTCLGDPCAVCDVRDAD
jgi:hypothetical protein